MDYDATFKVMFKTVDRIMFVIYILWNLGHVSWLRDVYGLTLSYTHTVKYTKQKVMVKFLYVEAQ